MSNPASSRRREVERAVVQDVHLDAVQHLDAGHVVRAPPRSRRAASARRSGRERARGPGAFRVVGDREVLVAELARGLHHVLDGVAAVAPATCACAGRRGCGAATPAAAAGPARRCRARCRPRAAPEGCRAARGGGRSRPRSGTRRRARAVQRRVFEVVAARPLARAAALRVRAAAGVPRRAAPVWSGVARNTSTAPFGGERDATWRSGGAPWPCPTAAPAHRAPRRACRRCRRPAASRRPPTARSAAGCRAASVVDGGAGSLDVLRDERGQRVRAAEGNASG